jgi:DNA-directed RNA polymerase specialized sigma24 family protein
MRAIRPLYRRGLTHAQLARELAVCPSTITTTLRAARARHPQWFPRRKRGRKVTARFIARLRAIRPLYRRGLTYAEIARELGVSFMTVAKTMAQARKRYPKWCPPRRTPRWRRRGSSIPLDILT